MTVTESSCQADFKIVPNLWIWWRIHWDIQDWRQGSIKKKEILKTLYLLSILATYIVALSLLSMYLLLLSSCYVRTSVIFTIAIAAILNTNQLGKTAVKIIFVISLLDLFSGVVIKQLYVPQKHSYAQHNTLAKAK